MRSTLTAFLLFALFMSGPPEPRKPLSEVRVNAVEAAVRMQYPGWSLERKIDEREGTVRSWVVTSDKFGKEKVIRVSATFFSSHSPEGARERLKLARPETAHPMVGAKELSGDGCLMWKGFVDSERRLLHCLAGTTFFSMVAPSEEVGRQFSESIIEALKQEDARK